MRSDSRRRRLHSAPKAVAMARDAMNMRGLARLEHATTAGGAAAQGRRQGEAARRTCPRPGVIVARVLDATLGARAKAAGRRVMA